MKRKSDVNWWVLWLRWLSHEKLHDMFFKSRSRFRVCPTSATAGMTQNNISLAWGRRKRLKLCVQYSNESVPIESPKITVRYRAVKNNWIKNGVKWCFRSWLLAAGQALYARVATTRLFHPFLPILSQWRDWAFWFCFPLGGIYYSKYRFDRFENRHSGSFPRDSYTHIGPHELDCVVVGGEWMKMYGGEADSVW